MPTKKLQPATEGKIVEGSEKGWRLYEGDKATDYIVHLQVHSGCRRDNPAWQLAIDEAIASGKYTTLKIIPLVRK